MGDVEMKDSRLDEVKEKLRSIIDCKNDFSLNQINAQFLVSNTEQLRSQIRQLADSIGMQEIDHPDPVTLLQAILTYVDTAMDQQMSAENIAKQVR